MEHVAGLRPHERLLQCREVGWKDEQFVSGSALTRQRGWPRQLYEGKAGSSAREENCVSPSYLQIPNEQTMGQAFT